MVSHDLNGKLVVENALGVIMLTSRDRLSVFFFFFLACRLINRHSELHSGAAKRQIIRGPCFPGGIVFCVSAGSQNMMDSFVQPQNSERET